MYSTIFNGKFFISLSTQLSYFKTFLSKGSSITSKKKTLRYSCTTQKSSTSMHFMGECSTLSMSNITCRQTQFFFYPWCMKPLSQSSAIQARKVHLVQWQVIYYLFYWWHSLMKNECNETSCCYGIESRWMNLTPINTIFKSFLSLTRADNSKNSSLLTSTWICLPKSRMLLHGQHLANNFQKNTRKVKKNSLHRHKALAKTSIWKHLWRYNKDTLYWTVISNRSKW